MAAPNSNSSNITMALAAKTTAVDVPKPRDNSFWTGKETFAAVAARSLPITRPRTSALPTPPNSISPSLPPLGFKHRSPATSPTPPPQHAVDSDIDLEDAVDHAKAQDQIQRGLALDHGHENLAGLDSVGAITPALLAKHHLPSILLAHGPLAIRHVMGYLTASVPGFAGIPPAKARRLVVAALEGKGSGEVGGLNGDVDFEKIGWGRWTAKRRGDHRKDSRGIRRHSPLATRRSASGRRASPPYLQTGVRIPLRSSRQDPRSHSHRKRSTVRSDRASHLATSYDRDSEDINMLTEADKMSLDGDERSSSDSRDPSPYLDDDLGEATDEEDWASIGAAALRQGSFPASSGGGGRIYNAHLLSTSGKGQKGSAGRGGSNLALSVPGTRSSIFHPLVLASVTNISAHLNAHARTGGDGVTEDLANGSQEREAVEALLRLGSV